MEMTVNEEIKSGIMDRILGISLGIATIPKFKNTVHRNDWVIFIGDEATTEWLRNVIPSLKLASGVVQLFCPGELVKRVKATVTVPPPQRHSDKLNRVHLGTGEVTFRTTSNN